MSDLNINTKLITDFINKFIKTLKNEINDLKGLYLYDFILKKLNQEIQIIENRTNDISIMKLFYFTITKKCSKCKKDSMNEVSLLFHSIMLNKESYTYNLNCGKCHQETEHMIITNQTPK